MHRNRTGKRGLLLVSFLVAGLFTAVKAQEKFCLVSAAFKDGDTIPVKYTCDGKNIVPPLSWSGAPKGTKSFALIMDDPDAPMGTWVHWVIYNIPSTSVGLTEGATAADVKATDCENSWGEKGYNGPCPPGETHRYFFKLYALDSTLTPASANKEGVLEAMKGHIMAEAELQGHFGR